MIPLVGEPLALDLINTRVRTPAGDEMDLLQSDVALRAWLDRQVDRLGPVRGQIEVQAVRRLRDHVAGAVDRVRHGQEPAAASLRALNAAQRAAPAHRELHWDGTAVTTTEHRSGDPTRDLLAQLAEAATDLLADPSIRKVRACEGSQCRLIFLPAHPRRRWCSPALCGNRARVARYYERHKANP